MVKGYIFWKFFSQPIQILMSDVCICQGNKNIGSRNDDFATLSGANTYHYNFSSMCACPTFSMKKPFSTIKKPLFVTYLILSFLIEIFNSPCIRQIPPFMQHWGYQDDFKLNMSLENIWNVPEYFKRTKREYSIDEIYNGTYKPCTYKTRIKLTSNILRWHHDPCNA